MSLFKKASPKRDSVVLPPTPPPAVPPLPSTSTSPAEPASAARIRSGSSKSRSSSPSGRRYREMPSPPDTPPKPVSSTSWWNDRTVVSRPWKDPPKRKNTIPPEQEAAWDHTSKAVANAAASVLGTAGDVAHEALLLSADALQLAPIVGLGEAARVLLSIWDSLQMVDSNRLACMRLTERCANILFAIRNEVQLAGGRVEQELVAPVRKLTDVFVNVHDLIDKIVHRPFLKRYLQRENIRGEINDCDVQLSDAVGLFSLSIQIRTLRTIQELGQKRQDAIASSATQLTPSSPSYQASNALGLAGVVSSPSPPITVKRSPLSQSMLPSISESPTSPISPTSPPSPGDVRKRMKALFEKQNEEDDAADIRDMRNLLRNCLATASDAELLQFLQIQRHEMPEALKTLQRALESCPEEDDTLDREFIEGGIDALRRLSRGYNVNLPSWTITKYEVELGKIVGIGSFAEVRKGKWRGKVCAVKVFANTSPRELFRHEVAVWKELSHPHVLPLWGASSTTADPPWFLVSPLLRNGSAVTYLARHPNADTLRMSRQIAEGMAYLHSHGVLHGDLKAANVLIDDTGGAIIADFGQSEMRSEIARLSGVQIRGTLRWTAPEVLLGTSLLTPAVDVYAFAICAAELLNNGQLPYGPLDDDGVRSLVLNGGRPLLPANISGGAAFKSLIETCWAQDFQKRPAFSSIAPDLTIIYRGEGGRPSDDIAPPPGLRSPPLEKEISPSLVPGPLPGNSMNRSSTAGTSGTSSTESGEQQPEQPSLSGLERVITPEDEKRRMTKRGKRISSLNAGLQSGEATPIQQRSRASSLTGPNGHSDFSEQALADRRNERRYRMQLAHTYHQSLTLPLWTPSPVAVGAVGYHVKGTGQFVTLFNARQTFEGIPSIEGYGSTKIDSQRTEVRNAPQRALDMFTGLFRKGDTRGVFSQPVSRRYSYALQAGHRKAYLCSESTVYTYMENLDAAKRWLSANLDEVLQRFSRAHNLTREDVVLIIGTLDARDWALFVSHNSPDGQVHFNVYSSPKNGTHWGVFSTDTGSTAPGPNYGEELPEGQASSVNKVSLTGRNGETANGKWDTVLLARLRFKPDAREPTSL